MFKAFKYLFLASLYKKAKKSFIMLFIYIVSFIFVQFIINDIQSVSTSAVVYILILVKWVIQITLLSLIGFSIFKIFNIASNPFESKENEVSVDTKKDRIITKEKLFTQSDLIMQKYMKD